jgi:psp operon transcriptional activator
VIGERGTGKELIAERLHHLSSRWAGPLVVMNCAALPESLIEAELFGHEAGSFTGAAKTRHGRFEEADGGTLFLDELGTLSSPAQDRLLRAVEYGEITRIGASKPISVDVRIVAATNENLPMQVEKGRFRADLLDRLSFEVVTLPPLRARSGDVPLLGDHFGRRMAVELDWPNWPGFSPRAVAEFEAYNWPGNVRELRNVVERGGLSLGRSGAGDRRDSVRSLPFALGAHGGAGAARRACGSGCRAGTCGRTCCGRSNGNDQRLPGGRFRI